VIFSNREVKSRMTFRAMEQIVFNCWKNGRRVSLFKNIYFQ